MVHDIRPRLRLCEYAIPANSKCTAEEDVSLIDLNVEKPDLGYLALRRTGETGNKINQSSLLPTTPITNTMSS
jgi:hypothetical protein